MNRGAREVNVYVDGVVKYTARDEIAARYEGMHLYSDGRKSGGFPDVGYTVRYVYPPDGMGVQAVKELPLGSAEQVAADAEHAKAQQTYDAAVQAQKDAAANVPQLTIGRGV